MLNGQKGKEFVRRPIWLFLAIVPFVLVGCGQSDSTPKPSAENRNTESNAPAADASAPTESHSNSKNKGYALPTAEEMAPMRPEYMAELAKIHEPPEMAGMPMQVRKAVSPNMVKLGNVMNAVGSPEKATHQQRATAIRDLLEIANSIEKDDGKVVVY